MTLQSINVPFGSILKLLIKMSHNLLKEAGRRIPALLVNTVIEHLSGGSGNVLLGNDVFSFLIVSRTTAALLI